MRSLAYARGSGTATLGYPLAEGSDWPLLRPFSALIDVARPRRRGRAPSTLVLFLRRERCDHSSSAAFCFPPHFLSAAVPTTSRRLLRQLERHCSSAAQAARRRRSTSRRSTFQTRCSPPRRTSTN